MPGHGGNRTYDLWNASPILVPNLWETWLEERFSRYVSTPFPSPPQIRYLLHTIFLCLINNGGGERTVANLVDCFHFDFICCIFLEASQSISSRFFSNTTDGEFPTFSTFLKFYSIFYKLAVPSLSGRRLN